MPNNYDLKKNSNQVFFLILILHSINNYVYFKAIVYIIVINGNGMYYTQTLSKSNIVKHGR